MRLQEALHAIRRLGALAEPVIHAIEVHPQVLLAFLAERVEEAETFDIPAVPTIATVGDHQRHRENTLEYYKSIKTGTTHQREHITIEEIPLQRENSMVKRTGARLLSRMFSFLKTFFIS